LLLVLAGRLAKVDEAKQEDWLARGRKRFEEVDTTDVSPAVRESILPTTDPTPPTIAEAARRVEARRSLLAAVNRCVEDIFLAGVFVTAVVAATIGLTAGVVVAVAVIALVVAVRRRGTSRAVEAVPFRQGLEPLGWALYYPAQIAQRVIAVETELEAAGDVTFVGQYEELEDQVDRAADGAPLPGQEAKLDAIAEHLIVRGPSIVSSVDASRSLASLLSNRALVASDLIRTDLQRQLGDGGSLWTFTRSGSVADTLAARAYGVLMDQSLRFATLPRPEEPTFDRSLAGMAQDPAFGALVTASQDLLALGGRAARGHWPAPPPTQWDLPTSRRWAIASSLTGVALVIGGLVLTTQNGSDNLAHTLIGVGVVLIPGTAGRVVKEAVSQRASSENATA